MMVHPEWIVQSVYDLCNRVEERQNTQKCKNRGRTHDLLHEKQVLYYGTYPENLRFTSEASSSILNWV